MNPFPTLARGVRIVSLAVAFTVVFLFRRPFDRSAGPVLLRQFLQTCGGCFVKAGQVLATRYDLLPAAYCQELTALFDRMPSVPLARIRPVVERELKRPLEAMYREFSAIPLASASLAQVHAAELHTGERVVVKVLRPGIEKTFRVDLAFIKRVARFTRRHRAIFRVDLTGMARDFIDLTLEELDLRREARNTDRMHRLMQADALGHCAPRVYFEFSGPRVITMERIEGVAVMDLLAAMEGRGSAGRDTAQLELWAQRGITPPGAAHLLLRSVLQQTMHHRLFQADPHPANLILLDGGALAWLDFGMLGWLDEHTWLQQFRLRTDVAFGRIHGAYEKLLELLQPLPAADLGGFEMKVKTIIRDWVEASSSPNADFREKSSGYFFARLFGAIRGSGLSLPANVMRLYRAVIIADSVMLRLDPEIDWVAILREFIEVEAKRQLKATVSESFSAPAIGQMLAGALHAPAATLQLIDWLNTRLPQIGRNYQQRVSLFERALLMGIGVTRAAIVLATIAIVWARFRFGVDRFTGGYWWLLAIAGVVTAIGLSRLLDEIDRA